MTITTLPTRNEYTATPSQTVFNYTFKIFTSTDLNVYVYAPDAECTDSNLTTDYVVDPNTIGDEDGGFLTFNSPIPTGWLVTIVSAIPDNRTTDYQNNGDFRPDTVNADFDRVVSLVKQNQDAVSRTLQIPECRQGPKPLTLPNPASGEFVRWKADETGLENYAFQAGGAVSDACEISYDGRVLCTYLDGKEQPDYAALRAALAAGAYVDGDQDINVLSPAGPSGYIVPIGSYVDNGGTVITGGAFAWIRVYSGAIDPAWFGFSASASGDTNRLALESVFALGGYVHAHINGEGTYTISNTSFVDSDSDYLSPVTTNYGIMLAGGKILTGDNATLNYTGSGNAVYIRNAGNILKGLTILSPDGSESALKIQGSSNRIKDIVITRASGGSTGPDKGVWLYSDRTSLQTDWNTVTNATINPAVLPVALQAVRSQPSPGGSNGAVNANGFQGEVNWRTSAATNGTVLYLNGGSADACDVVGNTFRGMDVTNYGGTDSKSVVLDGPNSTLTSFYDVIIDSSPNNTGYTLGAGTASTKIIGGTTDSAVAQYVQNNIDGVSNVYDFIASNNYVYIPRIHGEPWTSPTLLNSWVNFGVNEATAQFWKDATETVHIKGVVKSGTTTIGTQIFVLPVGYRPTENLTKTVVCGAAGSRVVAALTIGLNGAVAIDTCSSNAALSLDCSFRVF